MRIRLKCDVSVSLRWMLAFAAAICEIIRVIYK